MDRRSFIKGAALAGVGTVGAGFLAACSPNGKTDSDKSDEKNVSDGSATEGAISWRTPQDYSAQASEAGDYDAVVVGHGYAGVTSCRELSEQGYRVALLEFQPEETYMATGNESCGVNSNLVNKITEGNQYHDVDPVEYYQNWMTMIGNQGLSLIHI